MFQVNFIEVASFTHPVKATRRRLAALKDALNRKEHWPEPAYKELLKSWGHKEPPPTGADVAGAPSLHYKWCRSNAPGVGGYPCGLWLLFHTMLANSDGKRAHLTLQIIYDWTQVSERRRRHGFCVWLFSILLSFFSFQSGGFSFPPNELGGGEALSRGVHLLGGLGLVGEHFQVAFKWSSLTRWVGAGW
jgi:hypothetical protein